MNVRGYPFIVAIGLLVLGSGCVAGADSGDDSTPNASEEQQPGQASEASSSGCHAGECIVVNGSKRYVNYVKSGYYNGDVNAICSSHHLTVRTSTGALWLSSWGPHTCVYSGDHTYHYWWEGRDFPDHSRVCVTFAGRTACETVHS